MLERFRLLFLEQDEVLLRVIPRMLAGAGFERVRRAYSPELAWHWSQLQHFDLILCGSPLGAVPTCELLTGLLANQPGRRPSLIVSWADGCAATRVRELLRAGDLLLPSPYRPRQMLAAVECVLARRGTASSLRFCSSGY